MEKQTAESDVGDDVPAGVPLLHAMLMKLSTKETVRLSKKHKGSSHSHPDAVRNSVFYCSLESEEQGTCEEENFLDSTVRPDSDLEPPTSSSETEPENKALERTRGFPDLVPKWERKKLPPFTLTTQTQGTEQSWRQIEGKVLEEREKEQPGNEELLSPDALVPNSQSENPYQEICASPSNLSIPSEGDDCTKKKIKDELLEKASVCPPKPPPKPIRTKSNLTNQTLINSTNRAVRSASDPVARKRKEQRPLSAPSVSTQYEDCGSFANETPMRNSNKRDKAVVPKETAGTSLGLEDSGVESMLTEESFEMMEHENSLSKTQKKGMKNKMKHLTNKLIDKIKEKHNREYSGSKSSQDSGEEEAQSLSSMEMEVEAPERNFSPPPLPPKSGRYLCLERTFTLRDFKLNLEPINLMEEIFTGEEWLSYLPSKTSPAQKDNGDQLMKDNVLHPEEDTQSHDPQPTTELDQLKDRDYNQPDVNQDSVVSNTPQRNVTKLNRQLHIRQADPNSKIFAIPKAMIINTVINEEALEMDFESNNSDNIYECVDTTMVQQPDKSNFKELSVDDPLDFSAVKSYGLLDNSALKSRIRLSKKRPHRPPKKKRKVKNEKANTKFYNIPSTFLNEPNVWSSSPIGCTAWPLSTSPPWDAMHSTPHPPQIWSATP